MPPAWRGQDFGGLIAACREHGVAVMNIRVLAAGVIATDQRHGREVTITDDADLATEGRAGAGGVRAPGRPLRHPRPDRDPLRARQSGSRLRLVGMAELEHLEQALAAAAMGPLPEEALAELGELYASGFGRA